MRNEIEIVESCLHAVGTGQLARAPFAADVTWEGPPAPGKLAGAEVMDLLSRFRPLVEAIRIERHVVEGPWVVSMLELAAAPGRIQACVCFRLSNGLIQGIRTFYDPRTLAAGSPGAAGAKREE